MTKFGLSQPVARVEDGRFLRGQGSYIEDMVWPGELRVVFVRSPMAHAVIAGVDVEAARNAPGVRMVITGNDLEAAIDNTMGAVPIQQRDGGQSVMPRRPLLAVGKVRHVGEAVVAVVADTLAHAKDAADLVEVDYEDLDAVTSTDGALAPGAPQLHDEAPGNLCYDWAMGDEAATEAAFAGAAHTVALDLLNNRVVANPMETRGVIASWADGRLHLAVNGQGPWGIKSEAATRLGLEPDQVRVTHPDVGGGFGMKTHPYPEQLVAAHASMKLGKPVKWVSERQEGIASDAMGRDHVTCAEAAFDGDHRLVAMRFRSVAAMGAYLSPYATLIPSVLVSKVLTGVYDVQTYFFGVKGTFTNTTPTDAYRGAGRPEAIYAVERLMDYAAREMGVDPIELRRKNFIDAFPYVSATGENYDVGDFLKRLRGRKN